MKRTIVVAALAAAALGGASLAATPGGFDSGVYTPRTDAPTLQPASRAAITARSGRDPGEHYRALTRDLGEAFADRVDAPATPAQKKKLAKLDSSQVTSKHLGGERIERMLTHAPANDAPIGGIKVIAANGWFAARPSGTENIYKIYAESFRDAAHLRRILAEAQSIVDTALA